MSQPPGPEHRGRVALRPLLVYVVSWLALALLVALGVGLLLRGLEDDVTLPPVHETGLTTAADKAGCVLRRSAAAASEPPVSGPNGEPAAAGVYDAAPARASLVGALRRGVIVIHYRTDMSEDLIKQLQTLHAAVPRATIVTPNERMPYALAVTAWHRVLGCPAPSERTIEAIRLFRGRFLGSGPDSPD